MEEASKAEMVKDGTGQLSPEQQQEFGRLAALVGDRHLMIRVLAAEAEDTLQKMDAIRRQQFQPEAQGSGK